MKSLIFLFGGLLAAVAGGAQKNEDLIGGLLPLPSNLKVQYASGERSTFRYRGQPLVLYYWSTTCSGCISGFFKLDSLQQKVNGGVDFLLLTKEPAARVDAFFRKFRHLRPSLPIVTEAEKLLPQLTFRYVPLTVWVGKGRRIEAITGSDLVTEGHLAQFARGQVPPLQQTKHWISVEKRKPLLTQGPEFTGRARYYSLITDGLPVLFGGYGRHRVDSTRWRLYSLNVPLIALYYQAYESESRMNMYTRKARILFNLRDSSRFFDLNDPARAPRLFCYETVIAHSPDEGAIDALQQQMRHDLDRYFGLHSRLEKRKLPCYELTVVDSTKLSGNGDQREKRQFPRYYEVRGVSLDELRLVLNFVYRGELFELREPSLQKVSIDLYYQHSIEEIKKALRERGIEMRESEKEFTVVQVDQRPS